jgi:4-amino-4-deoxy-L-arabinose transferase-like glycosyltransferase
MSGLQDALARVDRKAFLIGFLLFIAALGFRIWGIGWGLPNENRHYSYHPDETVILGYSQQVEPAKFDFTPGFYNYGTLYLTTLRVASDLASAYGGSPDLDADGQISETESALAIGKMHMAGRIVSCLAGAGIVWLVWAMMRRRVVTFAAILGAAAVAVAPGMVVHSRFQTVDVLAVFFLVCSLFWTLRLIPDESESDPPLMKWVILAGVFAGLSAGVKYTGILGLFPLAGVLVMSCPKESRLKLLAAGIGAGIAAFLITTPGILLESEVFWKDFKYEMTHTQEGHGTVFAATSPGFIYHLANLTYGFGTLLTLMGLVGLVWAGIKKQPWAIAVGLFAVVYYFLIGRADIKFLRYTLPLMPVLAMGFAWMVSEAHKKENQYWKVVGFLGILGLGGMVSGGLGRSVIMSSWMANDDPRDEAADWLATNGEGKSVGLVSDAWFYTPPLYPQTGATRPFSQQHIDNMRAAYSPTVTQHLPLDVTKRKAWDSLLATDDQPDFIVYSSFESDDLKRIKQHGGPDSPHAGAVQDYLDFGAALVEHYEPSPVQVFGSDGPMIHDMMYIRPRILIWQKKQDSSTTSTGSSTASPQSEEQATTP